MIIIKKKYVYILLKWLEVPEAEAEVETREADSRTEVREETRDKEVDLLELELE